MLAASAGGGDMVDFFTNWRDRRKSRLMIDIKYIKIVVMAMLWDLENYISLNTISDRHHLFIKKQANILQWIHNFANRNE